MPMTRDEATRLLDSWRPVDDAARNIATALPAQIAERVAVLERERDKFGRDLMQMAMDSWGGANG
jgi:hypothetical protein